MPRVLLGSLHQMGLMWLCGVATRPRGLLIPEPLVVHGQEEGSGTPCLCMGLLG